MQRIHKATKSLPTLKLDVGYGQLCKSCISNLSCVL